VTLLDAIIASSLNVVFLVVVLSVVGLLLVKCLARHPAERYAICTTTIVCALASPILVVAHQLTGYGLFRLAIPLFASNPAVHGVGSLPQELPPLLNDANGAWAPLPLVLGLAASGWAIGIVVGMFRLMHGYRKTRALASRTRLWKSRLSRETMECVGDILGHRDFSVSISSDVAVPFVIRLTAPLIVIPADAEELLSPVQLKQIVLHEAAHVAMNHLAFSFAARLACILFWPIPCVHMLCRRLAQAQEEVCDNVASQVDGAACYARTLLAFAQGFSSVPQQNSALALLGPETSLEARITGLLDPRRNRMMKSNGLKWWVLAGVAVLTLSSVGFVAARTPTHAANKSIQGLAAVVPDGQGQIPGSRAPIPGKKAFVTLDDHGQGQNLSSGTAVAGSSAKAQLAAKLKAEALARGQGH